MKKIYGRYSYLFVCILFSVTVFSQKNESDLSYNRKEIMITMRDSIQLHTVVFPPKNLMSPTGGKSLAFRRRL